MRVQVDEATSRHAPLATSWTERPGAVWTTCAFAVENLQTCNSPPANSILPRPAVKRRGGRPEALVQQHLDLRDMPRQVQVPVRGQGADGVLARPVLRRLTASGAPPIPQPAGSRSPVAPRAPGDTRHGLGPRRPHRRVRGTHVPRARASGARAVPP